MNKYFLIAKAVLSVALAYYMPAFIPFICAYWIGVAFIIWRGKRGVAQPGSPRLAVEYLGGYPGLAAPQNIWLVADPAALLSGGLKVPYEAMRRVRTLERAEGEELARALGYAVTSGEGDLFLALLWRGGDGAEREILCRLPGGVGARGLTGLTARIEALRRESAQRRRQR